MSTSAERRMFLEQVRSYLAKNVGELRLDALQLADEKHRLEIARQMGRLSVLQDIIDEIEQLKESTE